MIYEYQEGRGIGLTAKLQAYALQDAGFDTIDANRALGFVDDQRDFSLPVAILRELSVNSVRLSRTIPTKRLARCERGVSTSSLRFPARPSRTSTRLPTFEQKKKEWATRSVLCPHKATTAVSTHYRAQIKCATTDPSGKPFKA